MNARLASREEPSLTELSDTLRESPNFLSEAIGDADPKALHAAWVDRDAMEVLRLLDKAAVDYERHLVNSATRTSDSSASIGHLMRAYGRTLQSIATPTALDAEASRDAAAAIHNHNFVLAAFNSIMGPRT